MTIFVSKTHSMKKIQSVEEAQQIFVESAIKRGVAIMNGDARIGNKYVPIQNEVLVYLFEHNSLATLQPMLSYTDFNVRLYAAYALLPLFEDKCRDVLAEIANGDYKIYGIQGLNAEMILKAWDSGELIYPYQSKFGKIDSTNKEDNPSDNMSSVEKVVDIEGFSAETLRLSRIFECPPTSDNDLRDEKNEFYLKLDPANQTLIIRINTFVNPYTQDVAMVYQERLERFKAFEYVAAISADKPSKLGFMQIRLNISKDQATDDVLTQIKETIYALYSEWKPNESIVWFKVEYHRAICYFEGAWWMPRRAIIKNNRGYERYDFTDEMKFDDEMWEITDVYDQFENSDSFILIDSKEFLEIWETTELDYIPKHY
mgnify:CR=1 FL=1